MTKEILSSPTGYKINKSKGSSINNVEYNYVIFNSLNNSPKDIPLQTKKSG